MSINIRHKYYCDFCGKDYGEPLEYALYHGMVPMVPQMPSHIHNRILCPDCEQAAITGIEKRLIVLRGGLEHLSG